MGVVPRILREASDYTYLGSYENDNGSLSQIGGEWRPPPGKEEPFDVDGITNSTTPNGCYVNLDYDTKFTADSPKKTGSLNYNDAFEERDSSRATKLRPKICLATEEVTQSCENDSEFSLLFL